LSGISFSHSTGGVCQDNDFAGLQSARQHWSFFFVVAFYPSCDAGVLSSFWGPYSYMAGKLAKYSGRVLHGVWLKPRRLRNSWLTKSPGSNGGAGWSCSSLAFMVAWTRLAATIASIDSIYLCVDDKSQGEVEIWNRTLILNWLLLTICVCLEVMSILVGQSVVVTRIVI